MLVNPFLEFFSMDHSTPANLNLKVTFIHEITKFTF